MPARSLVTVWWITTHTFCGASGIPFVHRKLVLPSDSTILRKVSVRMHCVRSSSRNNKKQKHLRYRLQSVEGVGLRLAPEFETQRCTSLIVAPHLGVCIVRHGGSISSRLNSHIKNKSRLLPKTDLAIPGSAALEARWIFGRS